MCRALVEDPEYLKAEQANSRGQAFDTLGLCLLAVTMVCWEVIDTVGRNASKAMPAKFLVILLKGKDAPVLIP